MLGNFQPGWKEWLSGELALSPRDKSQATPQDPQNLICLLPGESKQSGKILVV